MNLLMNKTVLLTLCVFGFIGGFSIIDHFYEKPKISIDFSIENYQYFFNKGAISKESLRVGWSHVEDWGVWSEEHEASLSLPIKKAAIKEISLDFVIQVFNGGHSSQNIEVYINNFHATTWSYPSKRNMHLKQLNFSLPRPIFSDRLKITFKISNPISPKDLQMSDDARKLGIGISQVSFITKGLDPNKIVQ